MPVVAIADAPRSHRLTVIPVIFPRRTEGKRAQVVPQRLAHRQLGTVTSPVLKRAAVAVRIEDVLHPVIAAGRVAIPGNRTVGPGIDKILAVSGPPRLTVCFRGMLRR